MSVRSAFVTAARSTVGTRFLHQGRVPRVGLDCAGLVLYAAAEVGLDPQDFPGRNYSRWPVMSDPDRASRRGVWLRDFVANQTREIDPAARQEGTILLFWVFRPGLPQHLAIVTGPETILHAWYDAGAVVETPLTGWHDKIVGAFELNGMD